MKAQIDGTKQSSDFKRISLVDQKQNEREQTTKADNNKKTSEALTANKRTSTVFGMLCSNSFSDRFRLQFLK